MTLNRKYNKITKYLNTFKKFLIFVVLKILQIYEININKKLKHYLVSQVTVF